MGGSKQGENDGVKDSGAAHINSTKPYLVRAIYDWAIDNGLTPQILVSTVFEDVAVPAQYIKDDEIVLNIHPASVKSLVLGNDHLMCSARFSGELFGITVPVAAIIAIYARENGQGMVFRKNENPVSPSAGGGDKNSQTTATGPGGKNDSASYLKVVK